MSHQHQPIAIIGSGLAGYMLAKEFRRHDTSTPLIMVAADDANFYSKPLLSTALAYQRTPQDLVVNTAAEMANQLQMTILSDCRVTQIDPVSRSLLCDKQGTEKIIEFSHLVLACGAEKIRLNLPGDHVAAIESVNDLQDYRRFRTWLENKKHIAILGAGLVGCEFANDLVQAGYHVEMIAPEQHPLARFIPAEIGDLLMQSLAKQGVTWHLGCVATQIQQSQQGYCVALSNQTQLHVDGVLSAIGLKPRIQLAAAAGITVNRGIVVNRWLQTNYRHIFALGDCAEVDGTVQQYIAPLLQCAKALALILVGGKEPVHYPSMPIVIKTPACPLVSAPPPLQVAGHWLIEGEAGDIRGLFHDTEGQLRGFALVGQKIRDKMELAKQLPLIFGEFY